MVGLALAGIYPIGMKLVVSWAPQRTGAALAVLVSMLVLGTGLPHLLRWGGGALPWQWIVTASSALALAGAALVAALGDGPHLPRRPARTPGPAPVSALSAFRLPRFRAAALGYFGHMWEVYALWTLAPLLVAATGISARFPWAGPYGLSFAIIGMGALGCLIGGRLSARLGSERVALAALTTSGLCALIFALFHGVLPAAALLPLMLLVGRFGSAGFAAILGSVGRCLPARGDRRGAGDPERGRLCDLDGLDRRCSGGSGRMRSGCCCPARRWGWRPMCSPAVAPGGDAGAVALTPLP